MRAHRAWFCISTALLVIASTASAGADDGVLQGQNHFRTGRCAQRTRRKTSVKGCARASLPHLTQANRAGGIHGRKLELQSIDDGYEPEKTIVATKKIIDDDKVFALVGPVGTPTSKAGQPIATAAKVPFIGPFTGAEFLRHPYNRYVVNIRASYFQETEAWIEHLTKDLGITKIAILYQDDAFGLAGLDGVNMAMAKRHLKLVSSGTFKRNTTAIKSAFLDIAKGQPQAVVTVGPYKPIAEFIKLARQQKMDAVFVAISFVGSNSLADELGKQGSGVIVSQVVPFPWDKSLPLVASYTAAVTAENAKAAPGFCFVRGLYGRPSRGRSLKTSSQRTDARSAARCDCESAIRSRWRNP